MKVNLTVETVSPDPSHYGRPISLVAYETAGRPPAQSPDRLIISGALSILTPSAGFDIKPGGKLQIEYTPPQGTD